MTTYDEIYKNFEVNFVSWITGLMVGYMLGAWVAYLIFVGSG